MKQVMAVACVMVLSGCASVNVKSRSPYDSLQDNEKFALLKEKTGLVLEDSAAYFYAVESAPEELKDYSQIRDAAPGGNVSSLFTKETLVPGDLLIAINDQAALPELDVSARLASLEERAWLTFYSPKERKIKLYVVSEKRLLSQIAFSSQPVRMNAVRVNSVVAESWADQRGYKYGDALLSYSLADSEAYKYTLFSSVIKKGNVRNAHGAFQDMVDATETILLAFADKNALLGTEGVSLEKQSLLKIGLIRERSFVTAKIHRMRFLGLGTEFGCEPLPRCGDVKPYIAVVYENSEAGRAGFQTRDEVEAINGEKVATSWEAVKKIRSAPLDRVMVFTIRRGLRVMEIKAAKGLVVVEE